MNPELNGSTMIEAKKPNASSNSGGVEVEETHTDQPSSSKLSNTRRSNITIDEGSNLETSISESNRKQEVKAVGRFFSISLVGSLENGHFNSVNDVFIKYSIVAGPDWIISSGTDVGVSQIARYRLDENGLRRFVWNQPIAVSYRSYNFHGWPQIVVSVYNFDLFGNDQILGYGCAHLPVSKTSNCKQVVKIYSPQSSSYTRQILSWLTGKKPELVDSNLFARGDCRSVLQVVTVGEIEFSFSLASKDVFNNGFRTGKYSTS